MTEQERLDQQEVLSEFERGHRLYQLRSHEGWNDLLDVAEAEVVKWEFRLLNLPSGSTDEMVRDVRAEAKVARAMFERIQIRVEQAIEQSTKLAEAAPINYQTTNL